MVGRSLSHYQILEKIGSGGMGDVYLALDTRLDRKVALKILPEELAAGPLRQERFQREAKASADGSYLYFSSDRGGSMNLWRVPVEETSGNVAGEPETVTAPTPYAAYLSGSSNPQRLAYAALTPSSNIYAIGFEPSSGTVVGEPQAVTGRSGLAVAADPSPRTVDLLHGISA